MHSFASSESRILPGVTGEHLQVASVKRLRAMAVARQPGHPWADMTNEALARDAGLVDFDPLTGELQVTLAGLLLLGTKEAVRTHLPFHRTQAVFRPGNWKRGAREDVRANLLETLDALAAFAARHLPSYRENEVEIRDAIFAEIFAHSLVTRDYAKPYPARFVIEADRVFMEHGMASGEKENDTDPNPLLANVFRQIGVAARPGAEDSAVSRWAKTYFGMRPLIIKGTVYRILGPFPGRESTLPKPKPDWDISGLLATQSPWVHSKAAQAQVAENGAVLETLLASRDPQVPNHAPLRPTPIFTAPTPVNPAPSQPPAPAPVQPTIRSAPTLPSSNIDEVSTAQESPARVQGPLYDDRIRKILEFCRTPRYRSEVQAHIGIVNRDYFRKDILNPLIEKGLLQPTLPDKPNSPNQQYATVMPLETSGATGARIGSGGN